MADTYTPYYNLTKPEVGGDPDTWGQLLNANFDTLDTNLNTANKTAAAAVPQAGGTMSGTLNLTPSSGNALTASAPLQITGSKPVILDGAAGANRALQFTTGGKLRWLVAGANGVAESGSNTGSNFEIDRYNDSGAVIDAPLSIVRSTGQVSLTVRPTWAGTTPWDTGNLNPGGLTVDSALAVRSGGNAGGSRMVFNWSGQGGQPSWLWGGGDGVNMYVYNPSNFSVNYANSAGSVNGVNNPAWAGSQVQWNSGINESGQLHIGGGGTMDTGSPWVMEGLRAGLNATDVWLRWVWLRNQ